MCLLRSKNRLNFLCCSIVIELALLSLVLAFTDENKNKSHVLPMWH